MTPSLILPGVNALDYPATGSGGWGSCPLVLLAKGKSRGLLLRKVPCIDPKKKKKKTEEKDQP